jgi:PIN domain nuclease of toxin-antitoxin system
VPTYLLDSSALLAVVFGERGAEVVAPLLKDSAIHSVQVAEVVKKLASRGVPQAQAESLIARLAVPVIGTFRDEEALYSRRYCAKGLSLGDRICLTVADRESLTAVTAEHRWQQVKEEDPTLPVQVLLIREKTH